MDTFHIKITCNRLKNRAPFWCQKCNSRPFLSSAVPLSQNEGRCSAFDMEIIFHSHANKTRFHKKGCAPSLILKVRVFGTRKWPIILVLSWGGAFAHFFKPQSVRFLFECQVPPWGICSFSKTKWQIPGGNEGHAWNWQSYYSESQTSSQRKLWQSGQQNRATCFATSLQNELKLKAMLHAFRSPQELVLLSIFYNKFPK